MKFVPQPSVVVTLTGPSCSGKTTLRDGLVATERWAPTISTTSRPRRTNEEGYHFVTRAYFEELIKSNQMVEWTVKGDNYYGTTKKAATGIGCDSLVSVLDPAGALAIRELSKSGDFIHLAYYMHVTPEAQLDRFANRLAIELAEFGAAGDGGTAQSKLLRRELKRFYDMNVVECHWLTQMTSICDRILQMQQIDELVAIIETDKRRAIEKYIESKQ